MAVPPRTVRSDDQSRALSAVPAPAPPPVGEPTVLVESKLDPPRPPRLALRRRRLIELLGSDGRIMLLAAPAGFGKSTLLAQWASEADLSVAWVTLDADDSDPIRFWLHVVEALDRAVPGAFRPRLDSFTLTALDELVWTVVNQMSTLEKGVALVLDDYHEIHSEEVDRSIGRLIDLLPAEARIVISTRRDPDLALSRLRAAEQLVEVRQRDLCYTESEAKDWLSHRGIEPSPDLVRESLAVTEGWPAAYTLMFGSRRHRVGIPVGPDHPHVAEYIRDEVVGNHDDDWPLLVVAAFCPRVCASLIEHTLQMPDGRRALRRLERSDVLLERVGGRGEWYALHRLVADHVLVGLDTDDQVKGWMVRAAEWHTANDHPRTALDMLIRAGEHRSACDIINRSWLTHLRAGQMATLRADLARIAPDVAEHSAAFLVTRAWLNAHGGRGLDALRDLQRAEAIAPAAQLPDGCPSVEASRAVINALYAVEGLGSVAASARRVDALIEPPSAWRPIADLAIGYASLMSGDLTGAQTAFDRVMASSDVLLRSVAVGWSSVIDVMESRPYSARARLDEVKPTWLEYPSLAQLPAVVVATSALSCAEGRPIEAVWALEDCRSRLGSSDPTDQLEVLLWLADAEASVGRSDRAQQWRDAARHLIERLGGSEWHLARLRDIEARSSQVAERSGRDPGLTDREQRILQLLAATHLSQREIGRELGISFNTIKSHVKAIYVKLGASSREEASQIARNRGLT